MVKVTMRYLILLAWLSSFVQGEVRHVPAQYPTIQVAIDDANDGDIVLVAPGTYTGDGNWDIDFKGKAISVKSEQGAESCIIVCSSSTWTHRSRNSHRGFTFHNNEDANSIVCRFTVTGAGYRYINNQ